MGENLPIVIVSIIILIILILLKYNSIISSRNKVKQAKSTISVYLVQRFCLIPNLVECVKTYSNYEKKVLEKITEMRMNYINKEEKDLAEGAKLNSQINVVLGIAETYPDLKASEHFLNLQKNLSKIENQIQAARRIYNSEVNLYNTKITTFPGNIYAKVCNFKHEDFFELEVGENQNINIKL